MLMKWEDLLPGDKVKIKEEVLNFYEEYYAAWVCYNINKIYIIRKITIYENVIHIILDNDKKYIIDKNGFMANEVFYRDCTFFEIIELCEDN